jgi:hypothetical protein
MSRVRDLLPVGLCDKDLETPFIGAFTASVTAGVETFERLGAEQD